MSVELTNTDRVVFGDDGITKGDVIDYYRQVAARMLPHLTGRPLVLERYRKDIEAGGFYQQGRPDHFPDYVPRVDVVRADGEVGHHTGCDSEEALIYLANQGVLTFHSWPAKLPDIERPDRLVLDLDPVDDDFESVRAAALMLREELERAGFEGLPMTTGSRGLHVIVPLDGTRTWEEVWPLAKELGAALVARDPTKLTRARYKSQRRGRLFVDTGRGRRGQLAIVPWTVRGRPGAPVATPITWEEVADAAIHARYWTVKTAPARPDDPWAAALS